MQTYVSTILCLSVYIVLFVSKPAIATDTHSKALQRVVNTFDQLCIRTLPDFSNANTIAKRHARNLKSESLQPLTGKTKKFKGTISVYSNNLLSETNTCSVEFFPDQTNLEKQDVYNIYAQLSSEISLKYKGLKNKFSELKEEPIKNINIILYEGNALFKVGDVHVELLFLANGFYGPSLTLVTPKKGYTLKGKELLSVLEQLKN